MYSIHNQVEFEFIERKSRFIGLLYPVKSIEDIQDILTLVKDAYPGATHYVYAYIINKTTQKASDDGEPQRTAGYPILDILNKNELNDCLAIVVRYFGGTKLGAGGLIRAYSHSIAEAIKKATFTKKVTRYYCSLVTQYDYLGEIEKIIREQTQLDKATYGKEIEFLFYVYDKDFERIKKSLFNFNAYQDKLSVHEEKQVYAIVKH